MDRTPAPTPPGATSPASPPAPDVEGLRRIPKPGRFVVLGLLFVIYVIAGKLGLSLAFVNASASAVWPPTGIALAAFLLLGESVWPVILLGAFVVNVTTAGTVVTSLFIAAGNTLEAAVAAALVKRFAHGAHAFERARTAFTFLALAAVFATTVSATMGVVTLAVANLVQWSDFGAVWLTWWLGDANGSLLIAPLLLLWARPGKFQWTASHKIEAIAVGVGLALVGAFVFGGFVLRPTPGQVYPLEFLCLPLFVWAAFRLSQREAITAVFVIASIAVWGTLHGIGPFARPDPNESLLLLQAFMGVATVTTLALSAEVSERRAVEERLLHLAVSDPMTGLANYRQLITSLEREIERSRRTARSFSILFLDVDHLKKINDSHGHLVGSAALRRVAAVLRRSSRTIDTVARFGGDEFAVVLPEAEEPAARQVMSRVAAHLAADETRPSIGVSAGVAVFPRDGKTLEELLGAADKALYQSKAVRRG
jgi:diguanylate cyclase (GGDEF)-like protein